MALRFGKFASGAVADFSWREYAPFGWLLAAESAFLLLATCLGTTWGMATAGRIALLVGGDGATHHPGFFVHLPAVFAYVETAIYTFAGAIVLPVALAGILAPFHASLRTATTRSDRIRGAILPTFLGLLASLGISILWQWVVAAGIAPAFRMFLGAGFNSVAATWAASSVLGYGFVAMVYYIPIVALRTGGSPGASFSGGLRDGLRLLPATFLFIFLFSVPALIVQLFLQLFPSLIVVRLRPELILVLLFVYAALTSVASYLSYSAAARLHSEESEEVA